MDVGARETVAPMAPAGILALVLASVLWGTTGTAASFLPDSVSPLAIGASTMGFGGVLLFATAPRMSWATVRDRAAVRWILIGAVGVVVYPLAFYTSMSLAGVAVGNVVTLGSGPVFAALLEWLVERRPLSRRWFVSTAIAVVGIGLLGAGGHGAEGAGAGSVPAGIALGLLGGLAYALYTYASSRAIGLGRPSRSVMGAMFGVGALGLLPVLAVTGGSLLGPGAPIGSVAIAAYLALGPMFVAYLLFGVGLRTVRSSAATTITLLEPVFATLLAVLVVGERLTAAGWAGFGLVLLGLLVLVAARSGPSDRKS